MGRLQGKIAIITGGARGMGAATARRFAAEGASVVIADVLDTEGEQLAHELGGDTAYHHLDVTDEAQWSALVDEVYRRFDCIDVLVNNAGINLFKAILDLEKTEFERVLRINLVGAFLGIKSVGLGMVRQRKGSIINISSSDGMKGANSLAAYCSSKWGVRGLTKVAAMELGLHGVRVNSVHPGGINTAMGNLAGQPVQELNKSYRLQPIQRIGEPEEVANVSLFLASDESSYLCGAEIAVDGGQLLGRYYEGLPGAPEL